MSERARERGKEWVAWSGVEWVCGSGNERHVAMMWLPLPQLLMGVLRSVLCVVLCIVLRGVLRLELRGS